MKKKMFDGTPGAVGGGSLEQCIALIDYDALNADEISFRVGDVINVTGKGSASGFWEGYVAVPSFPAVPTVEAGRDNERVDSSSAYPLPHPLRGLFPNCLVTSNMRFKMSMANYIFQNVALCLYSYEARGEGEMSFGPGDVITALRPSASPGWWYGVKSSGPAWTVPSATGKATPLIQASFRFADPAACGSDQTSASPQPPSSSSPSLFTSAVQPELLFPTNFVTCDVVLVTFNFVGRHAHELSCRNGDVVQVHRRWNDGWWEGSLRDCRGIFPSNYSVPNICTTTPPLFCARCRSVYPSNTFQTTCSTCAAEEHVENIMLQSLEAYVKGEVPTLDLFAGIDIGPLNDGDGGSGAEDEEKEVGCDADQATAAPNADEQFAASSSTADGKASKEKCKDKPRTRVVADFAAVGSDEKSDSFGGDYQSVSRPRRRAALLTEKDLADLASNRVKLIV